MIKSDNYEKVKLYIYQCIINKLIYHICDTRPDITLVINKLNKYNSDLRKNHL